MKKILIVEDDPFIRDITTVKLSEKQYETKTASDAESALRAISEDAPDVILLDLDLPDMKGGETFAAVKEEVAKTQSNARIIIFSNSSDEEVRKNALTNGAAAFFVKAETNFDDIIRFIETN